jgi:TonB-linked SusC/RagA family outer membrane protein
MKKIIRIYLLTFPKMHKEKWVLVRFLICSMLLFSFALSAQNKRTIKGQVLDEKREPLIGASVKVKGNESVSTITDIDGKFTLLVSENQKTLVISYVSYESKEVNIAESKFLTVELKNQSVDLSDVTVVGYGQQKKSSIVGAIIQTNGKTLERVGVTDVASALTGNLPGVITVSSTGSPGDETPKIYIRGASTWNSTDPLILVDGIERDINTVDISSVDNISVLKDASATAVFGVKGANGVILITTKRGKEGKAEIRVTVNNTIKMPSKLESKYDSYDALRIRNLAIERELGIYSASWSKYTPYAELDKYRNPSSQEEAERYPNVDWQDALVKDATMDYNASINISGGTKEVKYFTSVDYTNETDILKHWENGKTYDPGYGYKRLNVRSNLDINLTKTTVLSANLAGSYGVKQTAYGQDDWEYRIWQSIYSVPSDVYYPSYSDGSWGYYPPNTVSTINSALVLVNNGVRYTTTKKINTDFTLKQDLNAILKGLSAKGTFSYDNTFVSVGGKYDNGNVQQQYIDPTTGESTYSNYLGTNQFDWIAYHWSTNVDAATNSSTYRKLYYQLQLNYARKFGIQNVTAMGAFSRENYATGSEYPYLREDWVGRVTYDYASKYFAEVNGAYNGSEKFSSDNRFAFFPSAALGWMLSEENFMKELKFIDMLKIRASWGIVGSDNISGYDRWLYQTSWGYTNDDAHKANLGSTGGQSPYVWWYVNSTGNEDLQWETVTKKNIGIDYSFLHGLFSGTLDIFNDYRTNILLAGSSQAIPSYYGATAPVANKGKVKAHGYEYTIRLNKQLNKNLRIWGDFSMTHAVNKVIYADDAELLDSYQKTAGKSIGQGSYYITGNYYNTWDQVYGSTALTTYDAEKLPGDLSIMDYNGDGVIDSDDQAPTEYTETPENTFNTNIGFDWKNFGLVVQFYGVSNCSRYFELQSFGSQLDNVYKQGSYWSKDNTSADSPLPRWASTSAYYSGSTLYLYDASYLRLKSVELSYTFREPWVKKIGVNSLRFYVNGNNLILWSNLPDDREVNNGSSTAYPTVKRINLGLNVIF